MEKETLYRYVACQASPEEETAVLTWLDADPAHESELAEVQRQHDLVVMSAPVINELYAKDRTFRLGRALRRWCAAAAAAVLLAFGGYNFHVARDFSQRGEQLLTVSVPYGQRVNLTLQDGTSVWLNAGTTFRYPALFTGRERRVEIDGEARFEVAHDARHPFIVETYACDVEVLGTKFNVMAEERNGLFATALFEGRVAVTNRIVPGERLMLEPDEVVTLKGEHLCRAMIGSDEEYMWTNGIIGLTGQTFAELMHRFEKTFGVTIRIEREPSIRIGQGKIRQSVGIDNALEVLRRFGDFEYVKDEQSNTITIR
ncbi:FecR family protein [uncultured Alistipes sp.]|uniref:FecR family protein n=1 Tax=uncultured Alistipes sp. TaxID=538949 RepID=UPI00259779E3|nr:FecR family protein [uncultured Alistipes sp.]